MAEMMRSNLDVGLAGTQFAEFIDRVATGELKFLGDSVVDADGREVDWDQLYDSDAATMTAERMQAMENMWAEADACSSASQAAVETSRGAEGGHATLLVTEAATAEAGAAPAGADDIRAVVAPPEQAPSAASERRDSGKPRKRVSWSEELVQPTAAGCAQPCLFHPDNAYMGSDDPLGVAVKFLRDGNSREALLALEAEVRKNPDSSEGWRQLGQLYADLDQDAEAIRCLRSGHEVDPYNLDNLLALGISCANERDDLAALRYFRMWLEGHEDHHVLLHGLDVPSVVGEHGAPFEAWRKQITALFYDAAQRSPRDADVFAALGVVEGMNKRHEASVRAFAAACRLRPGDHKVWTRLGSALADDPWRKAAPPRGEETSKRWSLNDATEAYQFALRLNPSSARCWCNLGIVHEALGQLPDAASSYLSALQANPEAEHVWGFLHTAVGKADRFAKDTPLKWATTSTPAQLEAGNAAALDAISRQDLAEARKLMPGALDLSLPESPLEELADKLLAPMEL